GPVAPSFDTIKNGQYSPLSRPVFIYVSKAAYERPEVKDFVRFYIDNVKELAAEVGYIPLPDEEYAAVQGKLRPASKPPLHKATPARGTAGRPAPGRPPLRTQSKNNRNAGKERRPLPSIDFRNERRRRAERIVPAILSACAGVSVLTTLGIVLILVTETAS